MREISYKQTEIGTFPSDWKEVTIQDLGPISKGKGISRAECGTGVIPCVRYGEIYTDHDNYIKNFRSFISEKVAGTSRKLKFGELLFTGSGETKEDIGKCVAFVNNCNAYAGGDIVIVSPDQNEYDSLFLGYLMNDNYVVRQKALRAQGDAIVHITGTNLATVKLVVPPTIKEQQKIAKALRDMDALIDSLEVLIEKKRNIQSGAMQQLLSGEKRLEGFSRPWTKKTIGEIGTFQKGCVCPYMFPNSTFVEYSMPAFDNKQQPDICKGKSMSSSRTTIHGQVLLINKLNVRQKRIWLVEAESANSVCSGEFLPLQSDSCSLEYLKHLLLTDEIVNEWNANSTGTSNSQRRVTPSYVSSYELTIPSDINEQNAIATILSDMDKEIAALEQKRTKYEAMKKGMMQDLLTGKIRLV